ncbi:MAG: histidine kinase, partial [Lewinella sp.]|nr:histidine kinase [Lewinella sp.]
YWLSPLVFLLYLGYSVTVDLTVGERTRVQNSRATQTEQRHHSKPWTWILLPPTLLGLTLFGAAATFRGFSAFDKKKKAEEEANRRRLEAEIALLKSQINPHFLVNTLNNLYGLALTEPDKTPDALLKLSEMVSYILHECAQPKVPVSHDLAFITNYIALQQLRLPPNAELTLHWPEEIPEHLEIEPMILIPFIENAFKHGLTTRQACEISISITISGQELTLQVNNLVLPEKPAQQGNPSGIGINNTRQRLAHAYAGKHELSMDNDGAHHRITLTLNLAP